MQDDGRCRHAVTGCPDLDPFCDNCCYEPLDADTLYEGLS